MGSIGTPIDRVEMKIVDTETAEQCPPGELGEIVIRGPNVMLGYWNRPARHGQRDPRRLVSFRRYRPAWTSRDISTSSIA